MYMQPATRQAYGLLHDGALALARMESNGIPVNEQALDEAIAGTSMKIKDGIDELREMPVYAEQRKRYGAKTQIGSREQLADVFYNVMGFPGGKVSPKTGKLSLDDEALALISDPYAQKFKYVQKLHKLRSTYLYPCKSELCDGRIHAFFNLHKVVTYRSSCDSPNLQNLPIRDPEIGNVLRGIFQPHDSDHVMVEIDYSALEVHIAACYHRDPTMLEYLETGHDLHRDMAIECFRLDKIEKPIRTQTKGLFTFAAFYGDYWASIARNLWNFAAGHTMDSGKSLVEHLQSKGIVGLGNELAPTSDSFMQHIKNVEGRFWNQRFQIYDRWRKDWHREYLRNGFINTLTGFRIWGVFKRNEVINSPVQGAAFHCLLKSIVELTKRIAQRKMGTQLVVQIHDSLVAVVPRSELQEYIELAYEVMTQYIRQVWPWIIVNLKTEVEVAEGSWATKKAYHSN